jgi:hypothetical protein
MDAIDITQDLNILYDKNFYEIQKRAAYQLLQKI